MIFEQRRHSLPMLALIIVLLAVGTAAVGMPRTASAGPTVPQPVYNPTSFEAADPGVATDGDQFKILSTGGLARTASAPTPQGRWRTGGNALTRWPAWASGTGAVWAPDLVQTEGAWVLYYALIARDFGGQRCIGTAIAETIDGPFTPADRPLICPVLDGEDPAADRPVAGSGVIDPSPFVDTDGTRYLLYKTQKAPGTIRMVQLSEDGRHVAGSASAELIRHDDSIENPVLVKRGDQYLLFASANWYDQCRYATVWRRSSDPWSFADKAEQVLLDQANTGLCGPGGADVTASNGSGEDADVDRLILHGWVCGGATTPCAGAGQVTDPTKRRVVYAAVLTWGDDGATPAVPRFLRPLRT
ncbi:glycoside hydrolase family 43 protein [Microlunatus soli]|uniref:Glycosyl hydrolases family 43 n=1 Tax=Microlunatus soli TaxID=630515 RepID=A0A1H1Z289_9ACTN|nr:glycoside hydrolase family 43 protein [Microlunatus soli]SDT27841.1 Glycosyl hydrolases family 43 [Microlunatus soli]